MIVIYFTLKNVIFSQLVRILWKKQKNEKKKDKRSFLNKDECKVLLQTQSRILLRHKWGVKK